MCQVKVGKNFISHRNSKNGLLGGVSRDRSKLIHIAIVTYLKLMVLLTPILSGKRDIALLIIRLYNQQGYAVMLKYISKIHRTYAPKPFVFRRWRSQALMISVISIPD